MKSTVEVVFFLFAISVSILIVFYGCERYKIKYTDYVNDRVALLTPAEREYLSSLLKGCYDKDTVKIMIVIEKSLAGNTMREFMTRVFKQSNLNQMKSKRDLLIVMVMDDKQIQMMHGEGINKMMIRLNYTKILNDDFLASFRKGRYYEGLVNGIKAFIKSFESPNG